MADKGTLLSQFYVKIDGADVSTDLMGGIESMTVESSLHMPDVATLTILDPSLKWIDETLLSPGRALQISARAGGAGGPLFDGEIVEIEPNFGTAVPWMVVRAYDRLHRLSRGRKVRTFLNVSDGDIIQKLAREVGLQAKVGPTPQVHEYVLQANETNLEFLQGRASALGYLLYVQEKTLHCVPIEGGKETIPLQWAANLSEFHPRLTTLHQINTVTVRGWDPETRGELVGRAEKGRGGPKVGDGKSGGEVARAAFNLEADEFVCERPIRAQAEADSLAQAVADRFAGMFIEADGVCAGTPALVAGKEVDISAVGKRFSGTYFVTSATHQFLPESGYSTRFSVSGFHPATLLSLLSSKQERSVPGGLAIGVVTDNQDPKGQGRVKVKYPSLSVEHASDWARVISIGGGPDRGLEFIPEVNDEVLVGFELDDLHHPYVLGGLWNGCDKPPEKSDALVSGGKVQKRHIRSRTGHLITLNDGDSGGGILISDRAGNKIQILTDSNALNVEMSGDVTVKSKGNLTLDAQGQIEIKGLGVKVDAGAANVEIKGTMIDLN